MDAVVPAGAAVRAAGPVLLANGGPSMYLWSLRPGGDGGERVNRDGNGGGVCGVDG